MISHAFSPVEVPVRPSAVSGGVVRDYMLKFQAYRSRTRTLHIRSMLQRLQHESALIQGPSITRQSGGAARRMLSEIDDQAVVDTEHSIMAQVMVAFSEDARDQQAVAGGINRAM
jgi:hypothetical protein